jgi:SNF2 family DNA or RNA helicase
MGVGKTIQAIGYMGLHIDRWPALIVCPANVKYNWEKELLKWLPSASVEVIKTGKDEVPDSDFVIINYDLMNKQMDASTQARLQHRSV